MEIHLSPAQKQKLEELARSTGKPPEQVLDDLLDWAHGGHNGVTSEAGEPEDVWALAARLRAEVPEEEWGKLPPDLATNVDHYLYGAPKEE